jgi:hypothetical protein
MSEPVAHRFKWEEHEEWQYSDGYDATGAPNDPDYFAYEPLYTHPVAEDYSLTDEEIIDFIFKFFNLDVDTELSDDFWVKYEDLIDFAKELLNKKASEK